MASAVAQALGLGPVAGDLPFGKPLRVEVPLLGTAGTVPAAECFTVVPVAGNIDDDYFPRGIRIHVDAMGRSAKLVITTQNIIRQPIIEFRVVAGCTYGIARDYLLMVAAPVVSPAQAPTPTLPEQPKASRDSVPRSTVPVAETAPAPVAKGLPDGIAGIELVLDGDTTLDQLARQHYPGPLRRERFMRWVKEANPRLFSAGGDSAAQRLAAGTRLIIPATVPPRRPGDHAKTEGKASSSQAPATEAHIAPPAKKNEPATEAAAKPGAAKGANDRLVLGGGGSAKPPNIKEAVAMIDRLTGLLEQQVASQTEMAERLQKLEAGMAEMSKYVVQLETLSRQREAQWKEERRKDQEEAKKREQDGLVHLLLAVLGGGVLGAALLGVFHRLSSSRSGRVPEFGLPPPPPTDADMSAVFASQVDTSVTDEESDIAAQPISLCASPTVTPAVSSIEVKKEEAKSFTETQPIAPLSQVLDPVPPRQDHEPIAFSYQAAVAPPSSAPMPASAQDHPLHEVLHSGRDDAIELVDIMASMGLVQGAAQALVDHIKQDPRKSLHYWLKLLDIYRGSGMKDDYEKSATELRHTFNVQAPGWAAKPVSSLHQSLEGYPHIANHIQTVWHDEGCHAYLSELLFDHREGTREGFPQKVAEEILLLLAITSDR